MKIFLHISKILLTSLLTALTIFFLYTHFGDPGHPHSMGLENFFTAVGLGLGSALIAAITVSIVTAVRYQKSTMKRLKIVNLILLLIIILGVVVMLVTWR